MRSRHEWVGVQGASRGSGLVLSVMTNRYDLIGIARRQSVFAPQTWDHRIWDSARVAGCGVGLWVAMAEADGSHREPAAFVPASGSSETVGEQPEMADAHEAFGQHVEEESTQELHCVQGHDALLAAVSIILIAEG